MSGRGEFGGWFRGTGVSAGPGGLKFGLLAAIALVVAGLCSIGRGESVVMRSDLELLLVVGAPGNEEYEKRFAEMIDAWKQAAAKASVRCDVIGIDKAKSDDARLLEERFKAEQSRTDGSLWLVLIGHGTFDGREAKFNLRGPDISITQLGEWLKPVKRELVVIDVSSASAPILKAASTSDRIVVSATKSAEEVFYARFGEYFARTIGGLAAADIDQDNQVSVLEAFLHSARQVAEFYEADGRLATEHAVIDDNGDGVGTRAEVFQGVVAAKGDDKIQPDGDRSRQVCLVMSEEEARLPEAVRRRRDELERQIRALDAKKVSLEENEYYREVEKLMLELARIYGGAGT